MPVVRKIAQSGPSNYSAFSLDQMLGLASRRTASTARLSHCWSIAAFRCGHRSANHGILKPCGRASSAAAATTSQSFQGQDRFFNLFALQTKLGEHFIYIHLEPPRCSTTKWVDALETLNSYKRSQSD